MIAKIVAPFPAFKRSKFLQLISKELGRNRGIVTMKIIKQVIFGFLISLTLIFNGVAQDQYFLQDGKERRRPKEREKEKDPPKGPDRGDRGREGGKRDRRPD
jgi:hypothetical protein